MTVAGPMDMGGIINQSGDFQGTQHPSQSSQLKDVTLVVLGTYQTGAWGWPPWHTVLCRASQPAWCSAVPGSGHGAGGGAAVMRVEGGGNRPRGSRGEGQEGAQRDSKKPNRETERGSGRATGTLTCDRTADTHRDQCDTPVPQFGQQSVCQAHTLLDTCAHLHSQWDVQHL